MYFISQKTIPLLDSSRAAPACPS